MFGGASDTADRVDMAFLIIFSISVALLLIVTIAMITFVVKYRRKKNPVPTQVTTSTWLEITWTVVPTILVLIMFFVGFRAFQFLRAVPGEGMLVKVTARMWSWSFEYENGRMTDTLYVPLGNPVRLAITSTDVVHSLFVPAFRIKEDAVPGMETRLWFTATEAGSYDLFCAEYCGLLHAFMLSKVVVMPEEEFSMWYARADTGALAEAAAAPKSGLALLEERGCIACHSTDGSPRVGPTFKGVFGKEVTVTTSGSERKLVADEEYLERSISDPAADIVKDFPPVMPPQTDILSDAEIEELVRVLKELE
jgi:cytochrome c oxidase subunit 2